MSVVNLPSEDVGALVFEIGSYETRAGFAGDDHPLAVYPSAVGVTLPTADAGVVGSRPETVGEAASAEARKKIKVGTADLLYRRDHMELRSPFDADGLAVDVDVVQSLFDHALQSRLLCVAKEHPVLFVEPSWNTPAVRAKHTQMLFETYETPGIFLSKTAVLSTFMNAKASALVLDSGHNWTSAVPVHEGYVLRKSILRSPIAGARLNADLLSHLQRTLTDGPVRPLYECNRKEAGGEVRVTFQEFPNTHPTYRAFMLNEVIRDLKETICRVSEVDYSDAMAEKVPAVPYQLPDGRTVTLGTQRFKTPELLFKPDIYSFGSAAADDANNNNNNNDANFNGKQIRGAHELVYGAIQLVDYDLRKELWGNVVLAGGTTLLPGFKERLERDLSNISPVKVRTTASAVTVERKFSAWIGGSILASLGTFQQMWVSKAEYQENGPSICERKCP